MYNLFIKIKNKIRKPIIFTSICLFVIFTGLILFIIFSGNFGCKNKRFDIVILLGQPCQTFLPVNNNTNCINIYDLTFEDAFTVDKLFCEQCGGTWGIGPHRDGCNPPTPDAGKTCTDNSQCRGLCLTELDNETAIAGKCSREKFVFGCNREIIGGKTQSILCRD